MTRWTPSFILLTFLAFAVPVGAHHGDTELQAEAAAPDPATLYHYYLLIEQELQDLAARHPDKFRYEVIGHSVLGLNLYGVRVTNFATDVPPVDERYRLYFDGSIHSNEQLGMELVFEIIHFLLDEYDSNATARFIVDHRDSYFVPLVNPDGNLKDSRQNVRSVDLNRNFPAGWGGPGSAARGPAPLSEPETQAVAAYLERVRPHYLNSFHTGTVMLLHPYGNHEADAKAKSPDHVMFTRVCEELQPDMAQAHGGVDVPCGQIYNTIYPASGTTADFAYDAFGTVAFSFEVDDEQARLATVGDPRTRLGEAWVAVEHAYLHVHEYGAWMPLDDIRPVERGGREVSIRAAFDNQGYGPATHTVVRILREARGQAFEVPVGRVNPGEPAWILGPAMELLDGEPITVELTYNKTLFKGFVETQRVTFHVVRDGDIVRFEPGDPEAAAALEGPESRGRLPSMDATWLLGFAAVALGLAHRHRRNDP